MTCPECGRRLEDDYCAVCGYKMPAKLSTDAYKRHLAELRSVIAKVKERSK